MRFLRVGDPHAKPGNLEEMNRLMAFVLAEAQKHKVDRIEILGDLFHTHAIVRLEVLGFWTHWLSKLSDYFEVVVLEGNHDKSGDVNSDISALSVFDLAKKQNLKIISKPTLIGIYGYVPYIHDKTEFIEAVNGLCGQGARVIVCHQTFAGSKFENGMYAPDGLDPDLLPETLVQIISGHIHSEQEFGRVYYPGTARWDTQSDANRRKGIWIHVHRQDGTIDTREFISTSDVCTPIHSLEWKEGQGNLEIPNGKVSVLLIGTTAWVNEQKSLLRGRASVSVKITDTVNSVRKSGKSFQEFLSNSWKGGVPYERILGHLKELNLV